MHTKKLVKQTQAAESGQWVMQVKLHWESEVGEAGCYTLGEGKYPNSSQALTHAKSETSTNSYLYRIKQAHRD